MQRVIATTDKHCLRHSTVQIELQSYVRGLGFGANLQLQARGLKGSHKVCQWGDDARVWARLVVMGRFGARDVMGIM